MELAGSKNEHQFALGNNRRQKIGDYSYERFSGKEEMQLDLLEEAQAYIDSWDDFQRDSIEVLHTDFGTEPLPETLSAYVIVPVAAGQDTKNLQRTLAQYAKQDADPSTWSLLLFVNNTITDHEEPNSDIEDALEVIAEFRQQNPHLSVRVSYTSYIDEAPPIGSIRAEAWDLALYDIVQNNIANNNLIGITHDADAGWISPNYISSMQAVSAENPLVDMFAARLGWQKDGHYQSDANKLLRYWEYLDRIQYHKRGRTHSIAGANTAIRLSTYAAAGGYNRNSRQAELQDLQTRIELSRHLWYEDMTCVYAVDEALLKTDSRRIYQAMSEGVTPDLAWEHSPFLTGVDPIRSIDTVALANTPIPAPMMLKMLSAMEARHLYNIRNQARLRKLGRGIVGLPLEDTVLNY
jgi:hypothetical protein